MNWNQLQYIVTIAEERSITKAARKLFISQPSLSLSLQALEKELGTALFERKHSELQLTYAGSLFYEWALATLHSQQQLTQKLDDISNSSRQLIQIGISPHRSSIVLPPILKEFYSEFPDCEIRIVEQPTFILRNLLEKNEIDFMIDVPNPDMINYTNELLTEEQIVLAIPSSFLTHSNLSGSGTKVGIPSGPGITDLSLAETASFPYIMLSSNHVIGKLSRKICESCLFQPEIRLTCVNIETALTLVDQQLGAAFVPEIFSRQQRFVPNIQYFSIRHFHEKREICLIYPKRRYQTRQLKVLLDLFRKIVPELYML